MSSPAELAFLSQTSKGFILLLASLLCASSAQAWHVLPPGTTGWQEAGLGAIRGVTVGPIESAQLAGHGYGTAYSAALLDELQRLGVNWISVTPFGRLWSLSSTTIERDFEAPFADNQRAIERMIAQAHARGIKVLLIPHLWVETGGWRGEVDPGSDAGWRRYQAAYRDFVLDWAKLSARAHADAFSIGVECKSWSGRFPGYWKDLIHAVRATFPGLLTYSANWDEADQVLFWSELDLIGINAFYPLAQHNGAGFGDYLDGARRARDNVKRLADALEMPVLFVEVGYTTRRDAAVEPWLWPDDMTDVVYDEQEQARALAAVLELFVPEPWFAGLFVWRYYADLDDVSQEDAWGFSPHAKPAERVLKQAFGWGWGSDRAMKY
ncbi:MAG: hypothetical protein JWN48_2056 [Myxococcaceae bacterium]|nr:hypothetical protein [Myxococcaceae bacterium]